MKLRVAVCDDQPEVLESMKTILKETGLVSTVACYDNIRELREELGLQARPEELILCGVRRFEYESAFHGRPFDDNQVSRVYALWRDVEPEALTLQKEEVERVDWMDYDRCVQGVSEGSFPNCIRMDELEMLRHAWAVDSGTNCTNL